MFAELQAILANQQKDMFFVSEAAFLTEADLEETELPYAQFVQKQVHLPKSMALMYRLRFRDKRLTDLCTRLQGDLVLIPAGCPHQVVNCSPLPTVKVAQDFLAPESVSRCWEMMQEVTTHHCTLFWTVLDLNPAARDMTVSLSADARGPSHRQAAVTTDLALLCCTPGRGVQGMSWPCTLNLAVSPLEVSDLAD